LISLKEDASAPIPQQLVPETKYHDEHIATAQELLSMLPQRSLEGCDICAEEEFVVAMRSHTQSQSERDLQKHRYAEMLGRAERWPVPEELLALKEFMIQQLHESIRFDCSNDYRPDPPVRLTGERWREKELERASRDLAYHTIERQNEIQRTDERNSWLKVLWKALPAEGK